VVIPAELSVDSLKAKAAEPDKLRETMRDTMQREDLTDEQRRQIAENMRTVWEAEMTKRVDEYFGTGRGKNVGRQLTSGGADEGGAAAQRRRKERRRKTR
jgi:hypothetical protein